MTFRAFIDTPIINYDYLGELTPERRLGVIRIKVQRIKDQGECGNSFNSTPSRNAGLRETNTLLFRKQYNATI